jgi:ketosteroid isomerase-like protein
MSQDNAQLVRSAYEAFGRGDVPAVLDALAEDVVWNVPEPLPQATEAHGRDEVGAFFGTLASTWKDLDVQVDDLVAAGDRVCAIGRASGRLNGAATGYRFVHAWTVRDGALASFDEYVDPQPELLAR